MSPDLYPQLQNSSSFVLSGYAQCFYKGYITKPDISQVAAGFHPYAPNFLHVSQLDAREAYRLVFYPLTIKFVAGAIGFDTRFEFALTQKRLGQATLEVAGRDPRDSPPIYQSIRSLICNGHWDNLGLHLQLNGELDHAPLACYPAQDSVEHYRDVYEAVVHVPWDVVKYMFFQEIVFVLGNYERTRREWLDLQPH